MFHALEEPRFAGIAGHLADAAVRGFIALPRPDVAAAVAEAGQNAADGAEVARNALEALGRFYG